MAANVSIPIPLDFLETAANYPFLTELIQHPTNGYLYGCYMPGPASLGGIVKVSATNFSDITTVTFTSDGKHINPVDMVYSTSKDRFYVLFRIEGPSELLITEVHPATLARTDFISDTELNIGPGSVTTDETNLYVVSFNEDPSVIYGYRLTDGQFVPGASGALTGYTQAHCIRYFTGKLYVQGMTPPVTGYVLRVSTAGVVEEAATFEGIEGEFPVDDIGESTGNIYIGNRDLSGVLRQYNKSTFASPVLISTGQFSKCTCVKKAGSYVWATFENGRAVRFNPGNPSDKRIYTLNQGQGYHSEFTGGNEFIYTYNLFANKIARYHIPVSNDTVPPNVQFQQPGPGTFPQGTINLQCVYNDAVGVRVIEYYASNPSTGMDTLLATKTKAVNPGPGSDSTSFNTNGLSDGRYDFYAIAYDEANSTASNRHPVNVANAGIPGVTQNLWKFGGPTDSTTTSGPGLAVDQSSGQVAVTGRFTSTVDFGGGNRTSTGDKDIFVVKYSNTGTWLWDHTFGGGASAQEGLAVAIDSGGNVIIAGLFVGTINLDPSGVDTPIASNASSADVFVAKYTSSGTFVWQKRFGGTGNDALGMGIAVDSSDNIYLTSSFGFFGDGKINFGGGDLTTLGQYDIFLVKLNSSGVFGAGSWQRQIGSTDIDLPRAISVSGSRVAICGRVSGDANFGGGLVPGAGGQDAFVAVYSTVDGSYVWARTFGDDQDQSAWGVALDSSGNTFVCGDFFGTVNLGNGDLTANSGGSVFFAKYNTSGGLIWGRKFGNDPNQPVHAASVTVDNQDSAIFTGSHQVPIDWGFGTHSGGNRDTFVAKYDSSVSGVCLWSKRSSQGGSEGLIIRTDASNNIFISGTFTLQFTFGGNGGIVTSPGIAGYVVKIAK